MIVITTMSVGTARTPQTHEIVHNAVHAFKVVVLMVVVLVVVRCWY